ncbi:DUF1643 domain-containing protein [Magnetospira thiophila]
MIHSDAVMSNCEQYRYRLTRKWGEGKTCGFVMLNPSTADSIEDDPTIRRCINYARSWGFGGLIVVNIFAYRATDPESMKAAIDPVGPDNKEHVQSVAKLVSACGGPMVCAWGNNGTYKGQDKVVRQWFEEVGVVPMALAVTNCGQPRHPLYLKADLTPIPFPPAS